MSLRDLIERRIRDAQQAGKFRDLEGQGSPQNLEENPFEDPEMRVPYKVLRNAGFALPWMELIKEIDADLARTNRMWEDYRFHRRAQMDSVHRSTVAHFGELVQRMDEDRMAALHRLEERWTEINQKIAHLNATVPSDALHRHQLRLPELKARFDREFPPLSGVMRAS